MYKIASSNDIFEVTAAVLIKTEDKNATLSRARDAFNMMGFGNLGSNVHNEMISMGSPTLMAEVVEKLRLYESFSVNEKLRTVDLYKREPILVMFEQSDAIHTIVQMDVTIVSHSEFLLKNIKKGETEYAETISAKAGEYTMTPLGNLYITPTEYLNDEMLDKTIHYSRINPSLVADQYVGVLKLTLPDREASVINISYADASIPKALDLVTTLIEVYNENWVLNQNAKIKSIGEMINSRIDMTLKELNNAELEISSHMSKNLISDFNLASSAYFNQSLEFDKEIMQHRTQLNIAKAMLVSLSDAEYITLPANSGLADNGITAQIMEYNQLVLECKKLAANSAPGNVVVANMNKSLQLIREGIEKSLNGLIANINIIVESVEKQKSTSQKQLANTPNEARNLANVQREQKIKEELYLFLLEKREENDMSQSFASDNSHIIVKPHSSLLPIRPNKRLIIMAALIVAFFLPIALLLMLVLFDTTVHTKQDLDNLKASYLGEIPLAGENNHWKKLIGWLTNSGKRKKENNYSILVKENNRDIINESFRILRTNLSFMNMTNKNKVFAVTSILPGSGKTFISMNFAASYALKDKKVLVIDMDLRRASASKYLPDSKHLKGLADYLNEQDTDYRDIIIKNALMSNYDIIPVGTRPPNPAELILSERLSSLISTLREEYDYIFLDCPPIDIVAESGEIAPYADMALFVIRAGQYQKSMLPEIDELYNKKIFKNMVVLINGISNAGHSGYSRYGRYGYYGKYSHYGYYYTKE